MSRLLLLANPSASGFTGGLHREVVSILSERRDVEPAWPRTPDESRQMASEAARRGVETVAAMGGDGVVHHVANGLIGTESMLGVIPAGTTNVVARLLGIASNPKKAARSLAETDHATLVAASHIATVDNGGVEAQRFSTFSTGVGMDADVVNVAEQEPYRKYRFGGVHYARTAAEVVFKEYRSKEPDLVLRARDREIPAVGVMIQLHRRYTYFGRLPLGVAGHVPGTLSVLVLSELPLQVVPRILAAASMGRDLNQVRGCSALTALETVTVEAAGGAAAQADGESLGRIKRLTATIRPDALRVAIPQQ